MTGENSAGNNNDRYKQKGKWSRPRANDSRNSKKRKFEKKSEEVKAKRLNRNIEDADKAEGKETRQPFEGSGEPRRPKRKVACLIGYCGTGYHGMQVNPPEKTIEGDLFSAFVAAGAVSKDNANDPKKSSFMRAARTDKGVHAAGNVVSLKLIIEDEDIVEKINANLPEQIRLWGITRTNKAFECRKMCGSRIYEYLIPSYAFLPPKPESALAQRIRDANAENPEAGAFARADPVGEAFWADVRRQLAEAGVSDDDLKRTQKIVEDQELEDVKKRRSGQAQKSEKAKPEEKVSEEAAVEVTTNVDAEAPAAADAEKPETEKLSVLFKKIRAIENGARRAFRIDAKRLEEIRTAFRVYEGGHNFHNFTIGKDFNDASAQRYMKSLTVSEPFIINNTEWLSIKIHGQSFMLHQIRKMVAMVALVVRTGCPLDRITQAFNKPRINIPKAPSLGLLLEQPVYDAYNTRLGGFGYEGISFDKYKEQVEAFKFKHIYDKIYSEEAKENVFHGFFAFIDSFRGDPIFDYLTARGITDRPSQKKSNIKAAEGESTAATNGNEAEEEEIKFAVDDEDEEDELALKSGKAEDLEG
jgi:tRNA pseudouridine38-40 synthase